MAPSVNAAFDPAEMFSKQFLMASDFIAAVDHEEQFLGKLLFSMQRDVRAGFFLASFPFISGNVDPTAAEVFLEIVSLP